MKLFKDSLFCQDEKLTLLNGSRLFVESEDYKIKKIDGTEVTTTSTKVYKSAEKVVQVLLDSEVSQGNGFWNENSIDLGNGDYALGVKKIDNSTSLINYEATYTQLFNIPKTGVYTLTFDAIIQKISTAHFVRWEIEDTFSGERYSSQAIQGKNLVEDIYLENRGQTFTIKFFFNDKTLGENNGSEKIDYVDNIYLAIPSEEPETTVIGEIIDITNFDEGCYVICKEGCTLETEPFANHFSQDLKAQGNQFYIDVFVDDILTNIPNQFNPIVEPTAGQKVRLQRKFENVCDEMGLELSLFFYPKTQTTSINPNNQITNGTVTVNGNVYTIQDHVTIGQGQSAYYWFKLDISEILTPNGELEIIFNIPGDDNPFNIGSPTFQTRNLPESQKPIILAEFCVASDDCQQFIEFEFNCRRHGEVNGVIYRLPLDYSFEPTEASFESESYFNSRGVFKRQSSRDFQINYEIEITSGNRRLSIGLLKLISLGEFKLFNNDQFKEVLLVSNSISVNRENYDLTFDVTVPDENDKGCCC